MTTQGMSLRHACLAAGSAYPHTSGSGRGPAKCKYCKGPLYAVEGRWGVYVWAEDGRYLQRAPVKVYQRESAAVRAAGSRYVVRWIPA